MAIVVNETKWPSSDKCLACLIHRFAIPKPCEAGNSVSHGMVLWCSLNNAALSGALSVARDMEVILRSVDRSIIVDDMSLAGCSRALASEPFGETKVIRVVVAYNLLLGGGSGPVTAAAGGLGFAMPALVLSLVPSAVVHCSLLVVASLVGHVVIGLLGLSSAAATA